MKAHKNILAGIFSVTLATFLVLLKLYAWVITDSLSLFSSLLDSSFDVAVSIINLLAIRYALKPADDEHPYGHESIEDIVGLLQGAFIIGSACFIFYEALQRFFKPVTVSDNTLGIIIMIISVILSIILVIYQRLIISKTHSKVVEADSVHYLSDILSGLLVIISLTFSQKLGFGYIDSIFAIIISLYISFSAFKIARRSYDNLMNKEISVEDKNRIVEIIKSNNKIFGFHNLKTRYSGSKIFIQFDIELEGSITLKAAHDISDEITHAILWEYPNTEIIIHFDYEKD